MESMNGIPSPIDSLTAQLITGLGESQKIRYGAPDGPRQIDREHFDRREPIPYLGHEAVAQHLATAESERQFKSVQELADYFHVTRKPFFDPARRTRRWE